MTTQHHQVRAVEQIMEPFTNSFFKDYPWHGSCCIDHSMIPERLLKMQILYQ